MTSEPTTFDPGLYAGWRATPLGAITERLELDLVFELAGSLEGKALLDVGTGDGSYALEAAARGAVATGVDVDRAMLEAAAARARARGLSIALAEGCVEALPFEDASFDVVMAVTVLCFVEDEATALSEMARVLRPGGRLVVGELGRYSVWAARRRVLGLLGSRTWRAARFRTRGALGRAMRRAGLAVREARGAIHYPPSAFAARLGGAIDPFLSRVHAPGAAFLVVAADKPSRRA